MTKILNNLVISTFFLAAISQATSMSVDTGASQLKWEGAKVTGKHNGEIKIKDGQMNVDNGKLSGGTFVIDMTTMTNTDIEDAKSKEKLIGHLKSDDFFSVEKNPTSKFEISKVSEGSKTAGMTHEITGNLTIKGIQNQVTFPAKVEMKDGKMTANAKIIVDRTKYNIKYGSGQFFKGLGDKVINDNFTIDLNLVANSSSNKPKK